MFSNLDSAIGSDLKNNHFDVMLSDLIQVYYLKKKQFESKSMAYKRDAQKKRVKVEEE